MTEQTSSTAALAYDRFPVNVMTSDLSLREAKLIMTWPVDGVGRLVVWSAPDVVALDTSYLVGESDIKSKQVDWTIQTTDGVVVVQPGHGCACGNRLKLFRPAEFASHKMRTGRLT